LEKVTNHQVFVGAYLNSLSAFDVEESTIRIDAYLWIKWERCTDDKEGNHFRPDLSISLENDIQKIDTRIVPTYTEPICDLPGMFYMEWRFEGVFRQTLDYRKYPLDSHVIGFNVEDNIYPSAELVYVEDEGASGLGNSVSLSGWHVHDFTEEERTSHYDSSTFATLYDNTIYSNYRFSVSVDRGASVYVLKVLPPILITLGISGLMVLLDADSMDTRISTCVSGLLAEIFLQLTFTAYLPQQVDYLTLMDWIFNLSYLFISIIIVESIFIRKVYYRILLHSETLKDNIVLMNLAGDIASKSNPSENRPSIPTSDIMKEVEQTKDRKQKIKRRIRRLEKYFFAAYNFVVSFVVMFVTIGIYFS